MADIDIYKEAYSLFMKGQINKALTKLEQSTASASDAMELWELKARCYEKVERHEDAFQAALAVFEVVQRLERDTSVGLLLTLADGHLRHEDYEKASNMILMARDMVSSKRDKKEFEKRSHKALKKKVKVVMRSHKASTATAPEASSPAAREASPEAAESSFETSSEVDMRSQKASSPAAPEASSPAEAPESSVETSSEGSMGKRRAGRQKKTVESESRILLYTIRRNVSRKRYGELYTIDVEKDEVKKCPHAIYKDFGFSSVAALGSVIYVFGGHHPEIVGEYLIPDDEDDELRENPNLHCYAGYSCLDLNDDSGSGWKPAPPFKVIPIEQPLCHFISLCGKIYAIGYNDAEVFDPRCNDWNRVFPPPGFENFINLSQPVVADPSNKRMFLHFQSGNNFPLYAYYPNDDDSGGRWELLVEDFKPWTPGGVALVDGVLYFYFKKIRDVIGAAFDVETKRWLNINFSSKFDFETIMKRFIAFLHLGNGVLCLASYYIKQFETYVEVVKFRVRRTSSVDVLFTPISFRRHTIPTICRVSNIMPLSKYGIASFPENLAEMRRN